MLFNDYGIQIVVITYRTRRMKVEHNIFLTRGICRYKESFMDKKLNRN